MNLTIADLVDRMKNQPKLKIPPGDTSKDATLKWHIEKTCAYALSFCNRTKDDIEDGLGWLIVDMATDLYMTESGEDLTPQKIKSVQDGDAVITYMSPSAGGYVKYSGDSLFGSKGYDASLKTYRWLFRG